MSAQFPRGAFRAPAALAAIAAAVIAGACSKGEPQQAGKARPNVPLEAPAPRAGQRAGDDGIDAALKERLARQEAASRLFEKNVLEPPPPRAPDPPKALAAKVEPPVSAPSPKPPAPPPPAAIEPAKPVPAPAPTPAPASPPRTDIAAAKPTTAPEPASTAARLLSRVEPEFPPEALRAGVESGSVRARMTLDRDGNVTQVEVVEAVPRRVFDRAVVRALSQWKFSAGAAGRSVDGEVAFRR